MRFVLERVTQPDIEPVTLAEMRRHLRCYDDVTVDDDDITALIVGGRQWAESYTGRALIDQRWRLTLTDQEGAYDPVQTPPPGCYGHVDYRRGEILLRRSPALEIVSFVTVNSAGDETAVDASAYELREADSKWPRIVSLTGSGWTSGTFRVVFRAGYATREGSPQEDATVVPVAFAQAIKLWVEANYDRDEKMMAPLLETAERLLDQERCHFGL